MSVYVDWPNSIIHVTRSGLTLVQSSPTEIRQLDVNAFRLTLKDLEDNPPGMAYLKTHDHNTEVSVGGVTLARVVEILDPYTITFEDGQYAVNLFGANSNVGDRVNVNQVSVRSANSAGLVTAQAIEYGEYGGGVHYDEIGGVAGSVYPIGTPRQPVNNLADVRVIADFRGFDKLFIDENNLNTTSSNDLSGWEFYGRGSTKTRVYLASGVNTANTTYNSVLISGVENGESRYFNCRIGSLKNTHGDFFDCAITGPISMNNQQSEDHTVIYNNCYGFHDYIEIDFKNSPANYVFSNFSGKLKFKNLTNPSTFVDVQLDAGEVELESSCTEGTVSLRGIGQVKDDSNGTFVDTSVLVNSLAAIYRSRIYVDTTSAYSGVIYPVGTLDQPVNNIEDAVILLEKYSATELFVTSNVTISSGITLRNVAIQGDSDDQNYVIVDSNAQLYNCYFNALTITGDFITDNVFKYCVLNNINGAYGRFTTCIFAGYTNVASGGTLRMVNCGASSTNPATMNLGYGSIIGNSWAGKMDIRNMYGPGQVSLHTNYGNFSVDDTCTGGNVKLVGLGTLSGLANGTDVNVNDLQDIGAIPDSVWMSNLPSYSGLTDSAGKKLYDIPDYQTFSI